MVLIDPVCSLVTRVKGSLCVSPFVTTHMRFKRLSWTDSHRSDLLFFLLQKGRHPKKKTHCPERSESHSWDTRATRVLQLPVNPGKSERAANHNECSNRFRLKRGRERKGERETTMRREREANKTKNKEESRMTCLPSIRRRTRVSLTHSCGDLEHLQLL